MSEHLEMTVAEIEHTAERLIGLAAQLREYGAGARTKVELRPDPTVKRSSFRIEARMEGPLKPYPVVVKRAGAAKPRNEDRKTALSGPTLAKGLSLPEPITSSGLMKAWGVTRKHAANTITRWLSKGYLKRTGVGEYVRTRKYPGTSAFAPVANRNATAPAEVPPGRIHIERLDGKPKPTTKVEVEAALDQALKDRDKANAAGNETLARIYQDKVTKFEVQLSELAEGSEG